MISKSYISAKLKNVIASVETNDPEIIAVYLYGSRLSGNFRDDSDLDLAFLIDPGSYQPDCLQAISPVYIIATRLGLELDCQTDVVLLNTASIEMGYQIISTGQCIVDIDSEKRLDFEVSLRGMYFDFKPFLSAVRSNCIAGI